MPMTGHGHKTTGSGWTASPITKVEKYHDPDPPTPWIKTTTGIVTVAVVTSLLFLIMCTIIGVVLYKMHQRETAKIKGIEEIEKREDANDNKRQFKPKPTEGMIKPYDKTHPLQQFFSLPLPKVPKHPAPRPPRNEDPGPNTKSQTNTPSNNDDDVPTNMMKPSSHLELPDEKKTGSHVFHNLVSPSPTNLSTRPKPFMPTITAESPLPRNNSNTAFTPTMSPLDSDYVIMNRVFDGRAIDPVTGRVYEHNSQTNERRWVNTPDGQQVTSGDLN